MCELNACKKFLERARKQLNGIVIGALIASLCLANLVSSKTLAAQGWTTVYHNGQRKAVKYQVFPAMPVALRSANPVSTSWSYLRTRAADFGLTPDLVDIKLKNTQESLLGWHLHFSQEKDGVLIDGAGIIVSILKADNRIYEIYSTLHPQAQTKAGSMKPLSLDNAYDRAWSFLGVQGKLFETPKGTLRYITEKGKLRAAYRIELSTTAPYGAWQVYVDAESGKIIRYEDQRVSHKPWAKPVRLSQNKGALSNRHEVFAAFKQKQEKLRAAEVPTRTNGQARVFDPDPRTTLLDYTLQDTNAIGAFDNAYFQKELKDISFDGTKYKLEGPWVRILDWDPPMTEPSTSNSGHWDSGRGDNSFNDVMTYYHLDQSQRYMQALGYVGARGIQSAPIEVDTNGVNGDDNSYFQPGSNRLSFGHGCVDDNEDADVILHEYGHAIHYSINPNWGGGDTGAIGEGFGDYWAASYSYSTSNGSQFFPNFIYSWDGHGEGSPCWSGRILNAWNARYESTTSYRAHTAITGGFQSDELWSTPLFQSLVALRAIGVPREEVDTVILEAQFGLGAGITMREMAQSILLTAQLLYPNGPHSRVFKENFVRMNIIEEPHAIIAANLSEVKDASDNGVIEHGEEVELTFAVKNSGSLVASHVTGTLSSNDEQLAIVQASADYPDLEPGQASVNATAFRIQTRAGAACGGILKLQLTVRYDGDLTASLPLELRVGQALGVSARSIPNVMIPDADPKGVVDAIMVQNQGKVSDQFTVGINVLHPYRGDLKIVLISPSGKLVILHDRAGIDGDDVVGVYPKTLQPMESLSSLIGEPLSGNWQLQVADMASADVGTFRSWSIEDITGYQCQ